MTPKQVEQLRKDAIKKLTQTHHRIASTATTDAVAAKIEEITGRERRPRQLRSDYIKCWLDAVTAPINPTYQRTFSKMKTPHKDMAGSKYSRVADINRDQPPLITPDGIGNGYEGMYGTGRRP